VSMPNPDEKDIVYDDKPRAHCADCGRPYGDEYGFPDLVVSDDVWAKISGPTGNGLLCPSCLCHRSHNAGVKNAVAVFRSGPFVGYDIVDETAGVVERLRCWEKHYDDSIIYHAADLLERLSRERGTVQEGWRDISTAPKDGRDLLCWSDGIGIGAMVLYWMDGYWREKANGMGLKREPTHWMPIPCAPGSAAPQPPIADDQVPRPAITGSAAFLMEIAAQKAEIERLRAERDEAYAAMGNETPALPAWNELPEATRSRLVDVGRMFADEWSGADLAVNFYDALRRTLRGDHA
jgi:hypothetical protein